MDGTVEHIDMELKVARRDGTPPTLEVDAGPSLKLLSLASKFQCNREIMKNRGGENESRSCSHFPYKMHPLPNHRNFSHPSSRSFLRFASLVAADMVLLRCLLRVVRGGGGVGDKHATFDKLLEVIQVLQSLPASETTEVAVQEEKGGSESLAIIRSALEEERVKNLLTSNPNLISVIGRLVPSLIKKGEEVRGGEEQSNKLPSQFLAPLACLSDISVPKLCPILLSTHSKPLRSSLRSSQLAHRRTRSQILS